MFSTKGPRVFGNSGDIDTHGTMILLLIKVHCDLPSRRVSFMSSANMKAVYTEQLLLLSNTCPKEYMHCRI